MIRSRQGRGSFRNTFFHNLETVNIKMFANHEVIYTKIKALPVNRIVEVFIFEVNFSKFS